MLEGLAVWILNNYIGEYVEDFSTENLSLGIFQGSLELENLPLKKDALKKLELPLEVRAGFIGKILVSIPLKRLNSEPWVITLEKLYLVAGPLKHQQYNESEEKKWTQEYKVEQLKALEDKWKLGSGSVAPSGGGGGWFSSAYYNILENIQLNVKDVHLRYEDNETIPGSSFACGVTIKSLSAQSADTSWLPKFVNRFQADMMRKLVDLNGFSSYWDTDAAMIGDLDKSQIEDALQRPMSETASTGEFKDHEFLLEPVSLQAKMRRNTSLHPLRGSDNPRIQLDMTLDKIPVSLSEDQYRGMVAWMKEFSRHNKRRKYRRWKPMSTLKDDPKKWWKYAIDAHLHAIHDRNQRRSVEFITRRCRDIVLYVDAYIDYIAIGTTYMEERLKYHMEYMEDELSFEELKILREIGRRKMTTAVPPSSIKEPTPEMSSKTKSSSAPVTPDEAPTPSETPSHQDISPTTPTQPSPTTASQGKGMFQRWFPGWGGWGGAQEATGSSEAPGSGEQGPELAGPNKETEDQKFEQAVYDLLKDTPDNNTLLRRDTVFAQLNFKLQSAVFRLRNTSENAPSPHPDSPKPSDVLMELECSQVSMDFQSRPRTNGMRFGISVGGLYLRDKMTPDSIMPVLIAPQHRDRSSSNQSRPAFTGVLGSGLGRTSSPMQSLIGTSTASHSSDQVLFELLYEKKPIHTKADYRLDIKTKPLDIVYNPASILRLKDFFTVKRGVSAVRSEIELAAAAKSKYEEIRRQTEQELKQTLDEILEDDDRIKAKRWVFNMDIAAPQIIIPQDFKQTNTTLVVFDLGHLQFQNMTAGIKDDIKQEEEEDEDFVTPSSTTPEEKVPSASVPPDKAQSDLLSELFNENLSENTIRDKIYDKYKLKLSDLQVMVGRANDNWRVAHSKGTSLLHVVDKFSISVQFDRRLLYTSDPQWPKATIAGTLPSLTLHFNEQKIQALRECALLINEHRSSGPGLEPSASLSNTSTQSDPGQPETSMYYNVYQAYSKTIQGGVVADDQQTKQAVADSKLLLMQFSINHVSLEVQSRDRSIAELQVKGVCTNFTKRPYDMSLAFSIHSLLVVDALQTFGSDFELLVASHKNLCLDSHSGSIRDSEPNSPLSQMSPVSPSSPAEPAKPPPPGLKANVHAAVSNALQSLANNIGGNTLSPDSTPVISPFSSINLPSSASQGLPGGLLGQAVDSDALIKMELDIITPHCPTNASGDETLHIANIQFNNLDFIANQQTLVELAGFFQRVLPSSKKKKRKKSKSRMEEKELEKPVVIPEKKMRWELSAEFHRLNILLMRVDGDVGRKVATATMSEAKVDITVASGDVDLEGSLGGLQFQNLTPEASRHQKILSVGTDPLSLDTSLCLSPRDFQGPDMYKTAQDSSMIMDTADKAFIFTLSKPSVNKDKSAAESPGEFNSFTTKGASQRDEVIVTLRIASVWYTHSPAFLKQLGMCVTEFQDYMAGVGSTIKTAATEMAIGLVNQRSDLGTSMYGSNVSLDATVPPAPGKVSKRPPSMSELAMEGGMESFSRSLDDCVIEESSSTVLKIDVILQTPVILLPRTPNSSEVLVAHLGRISIRNFDQPSTSTLNDSLDFQQRMLENREEIYLEIRDMTLYSVDLDKQKALQQEAQAHGPSLSTSVFHTPQPGGFIRESYGRPILHDTLLELTLQKQETTDRYKSEHAIEITMGNTEQSQDEETDEPVKISVLQATGRVISPLKLALSKQVYEQILQTLDNITPNDDDEDDITCVDGMTDTQSSSLLQDIAEDSVLDIHPSVSALKLDLDLSSASKPSRSFSRESILAAGRESSTKLDENPMVFRAYFEMPVFNVEMTGDLGEGEEQGLVDLRLEDFKVNYEKGDPWTKSIEISLHSLIMEDLLQDRESKHRYLMVSTQIAPMAPLTPETPRVPLSHSCPTSMIDVLPPDLPPSLPSSFHQENVFLSGERKTRVTAGSRSTGEAANTTSFVPCAPPPSRISSRRSSGCDEGKLVHLKVFLVDRKCPDFASKYNNTHRYIDVDFNGLDTTVNLQTWVVLLDFLGMGAKVQDPENFRHNSQMFNSTSEPADLSETANTTLEGEVTNSEVKLKINSLTLILNKNEYELARANVSRFDSRVSLRDGTFAIKGQLGSMSLQDQSPHGHMYKERFMTSGNQALDFDIFKYGTPDPDLQKEHDISVKLRMSSVWYVHTQRFIQETLAFCQNFNQLQDVLGRSRAASAGVKIAETAFRGSRISMDIEAGAPIILIPHSSESNDILVMDLGTLSVQNSFLTAGSEGTIQHKLQKSRTKSDADSATGSGFLSCVSNSSRNSYQTAPEGSNSMDLNSPMTQSIYGSLDSDWRNSDMESASAYGSASDNASVSSDSTVVGSASYLTGAQPKSGSLDSFYSAVSSSGLPSRSSSIGAKPKDPGRTAAHPPDPARSNQRVPFRIQTWPMPLEFDAESHECLLDVWSVELTEIDLFSAIWTKKEEYEESDKIQDLIFPSYVVKRESGKVLKDKARLTLQVERNLESDISHAVPDFSIDGKLTSVHFQLDLKQYQLIRGILAHNFGENLESFQRPMMSQLQDPRIHTVLSGDVWKGISITLGLDGVAAEFLIAHADPSNPEECPEASLAKFDFIASRLLFDSFSDGSKDVDLVSHGIRICDTRYQDSPVNVRPNVFPEILKPAVDRSHPDALQMELHYRSNKDMTRFTILLNNMRVMGIFDWLLACKDFILTGPVDPYKKDSDGETSPGDYMQTSQESGNPATVSTGIITKRGSSYIEKKETFELRLNVTDTELVVVEDTTGRDTNAVILKSTAVLSYKPSTDRPVSCSLQSLEVFSCSLAAEEETALSIIDPMSITMELNGNPERKHERLGSGGLMDVASEQFKPPILEIAFNTLNIRLSYNDMKLFLAILKTVPKQLLQAKQQHPPPPKNAVQCKYPVEQVSKLQQLGFAQEDCETALVECQGHLDDAAMWLTQYCESVASSPPAEQGSGFAICGFEVKSDGICLCFIDDCLDADVPLAELTFSSFSCLHKLQSGGEGNAEFRLAGDYYNRSLSGWEPFIEPWRCGLKWSQSHHEENKLKLDIIANQVLNMNVTSTLVEQYSKTKVKWTEDYYKQQSQSSEEGSYNSRKRVPFIPYAIRNHTGCKLWFATMTTTPTKISGSDGASSPGNKEDSSQYKISEWKEVIPDTERSFMFEEREKMRHKHTHLLKVHQVVVQVEGWREVSPVSVDKVGTYFRTARPEIIPSGSCFQPPARIVFDVTLEGSARKVITVRSGLMLYNRLEDDVEVRLENTLALSPSSPTSPVSPTENKKVLFVPTGDHQALPLPLVHSRMWIRPQGWSLNWCKKPVLWQHVDKPGEYNDSIKMCDTIFSEKGCYRFCVSTYKHHFPPSQFSLSGSGSLSPSSGSVYNHPGHLITLMPPVRLENLLPVDMTYTLKTASSVTVPGTIKPGKIASLVVADVTQQLELGISLDNFTTCKDLVIPPGTLDYRVKLVLHDRETERPLELTIRIKAGMGGSLRLSVSAPYWLVNKTGLPLIFKQHAAKTAAGQFEEHELARSVTPLLFSYTEKDKTSMCTMRLGKYVHGVKAHAQWCHRFSLERGSGVRELHITPNDNRPDWVYMIGIEVRQGRGRYCDTHIITFSPRYQLDNRSSHKLAFAQRYAVQDWSPSSVDYFSALPNCTLSFHWPRVDKDNLLCVQLMDNPDSQWSGGFRIDKVDSYHINIRCKDDKFTFLRVDVVLHGATFFIVFGDADHMPPPYRVENFSEVSVQFYQTRTQNQKQRTTVKPKSQVPYALDEPILPSHLTVKVLGGSSATYDMDTIKEGDHLYYENHIYLALTGTFRRPGQAVGMSASWSGMGYLEQNQLVLDVLPNNRVILKKMETGKRSQLWRMTGTGMLQHEGSAVPRDPRKPHSPTSSPASSVVYVLDIQDIALQPSREMALTIRKAEERRKSTQTWRFTKDGRLCCGSRGNLCVQAKNGIFGLRDGEEAVLGPSPPTLHNKADVPIEMAIHNEKSRPGSGVLAVKVLTDGPTRVLRITDVTQQQLRSQQKEDWVLVEGRQKLPPLSRTPSQQSKTTRILEVSLDLPEGVGMSLINKTSEELLYMTLREIRVDYYSSPTGQNLNITINKLQVDNQLLGAYHPVLLYVNSPNQGDDDEDLGPSLNFSLHKVPNEQWNADIYKHLNFVMKRVVVLIEEKLLWKMLQFFGFTEIDSEVENLTETGMESIGEVTAATSSHLKRYYFGTLKIDIRNLMLSMITASDLSPDLKLVKKSMGIPLVKFADAQVDLEHYVRHHIFETSAFLIESIMHHFTEELKSQAASILGSVDFLGNPLGFFNDVAEGVSGLLEGNVGGLFRNVTHGVSNSAAKVTSSLSDGIGVATLDMTHQKMRDQIRYETNLPEMGSGGHLLAGIRGLGHGLFGGLTSIVSQPYRGAKQEGVEGFLKGVGKGIVGTVTKPVAGVLDFASGAASAVRDTSRSSNKTTPRRVRRPRSSLGAGGLLPIYNEDIARAQETLHNLNESNYKERCIATEQLRNNSSDALRALISNEHVYFLGKMPREKEYPVLEPSFEELLHSRAVNSEGKQYLELTIKADPDSRGLHGFEGTKKPLIKCDSEYVAQKVAQQINYAKVLYDEVKQTLPPDTGREED